MNRIEPRHIGNNEHGARILIEDTLQLICIRDGVIFHEVEIKKSKTSIN